MKSFMTYLFGTIILLPIFVGICANNLLCVTGVFVYVAGIIFSAIKYEKVMCFWCAYIEAISGFSKQLFGA